MQLSSSRSARCHQQWHAMQPLVRAPSQHAGEMAVNYGHKEQLKCMHTKYKGTNGEEGAASLKRAAFFTPDE